MVELEDIRKDAQIRTFFSETFASIGGEPQKYESLRFEICPVLSSWCERDRVHGEQIYDPYYINYPLKSESEFDVASVNYALGEMLSRAIKPEGSL